MYDDEHHTCTEGALPFPNPLTLFLFTLPKHILTTLLSSFTVLARAPLFALITSLLILLRRRPAYRALLLFCLVRAPLAVLPWWQLLNVPACLRPLSGAVAWRVRGYLDGALRDIARVFGGAYLVVRYLVCPFLPAAVVDFVLWAALEVCKAWVVSMVLLAVVPVVYLLVTRVVPGVVYLVVSLVWALLGAVVEEVLRQWPDWVYYGVRGYAAFVVVGLVVSSTRWGMLEAFSFLFPSTLMDWVADFFYVVGDWLGDVIRSFGDWIVFQFFGVGDAFRVLGGHSINWL
ncbi:hypothetical protein B0T22DRAFT_439780 [Podospora appendiculata]|uniref:Uncharacterized protein n=1 Tax=Podospora appendiculata TaxID=314037 RepID=A0AAE0X902_9PEZI|nr:hypothetical protein B0T22DRAFT_439780 [Podospora appendiculata]